MGSTKQKYLTRRQVDVIDDLFSGRMTEPEVLAKHKVGTLVYRKWLRDEAFADELAFRIESARRQSDIIIAQCAPMAAAKLVQLTESKKEETARKACLDIVTRPEAGASPKDTLTDEKEEFASNLSPELAAKLLKTLAGEKGS